MQSSQRWRSVLAAVVCAALGGSLVLLAQAAQTSGREKDTAEIRAHIESIFEAFINKDAAKLAATHGRDWRGYLTGSRTVIKGRDGYLRAAGAAGPMGPKGQGMVGYRIREYDTVFYGDVAVVNFVADVDHMNGTAARTSTLTLMDIYAKEDGAWTQVASQTSFHPDYQDTMRSTLQSLTDAQKAPILATREALWRAWYAADTKRLTELLAPELVTLNPDDGFGTYDSVLAGSAHFATTKTRLIRVSFPKTEFQVYANTVILYSTYELAFETAGVSYTERGKATEVFVRRSGKWISTGWQLAPES